MGSSRRRGRETACSNGFFSFEAFQAFLATVAQLMEALRQACLVSSCLSRDRSTSLMTHQEGRAADCVRVWKRQREKKLEGR